MQTGAGEEVVDRGDPRGSLTGARGVSSKEKGRKEGGGKGGYWPRSTQREGKMWKRLCLPLIPDFLGWGWRLVRGTVSVGWLLAGQIKGGVHLRRGRS